MRRASFLLFLAACGAPEPPKTPAASEPPPAPVAKRTGPRMGMSSELGEIDENATKATFDRTRPALMNCYTTGATRLEYLAGDVKFYLRIQETGHVAWAVLEESSLGDRATETCMLDALRAASWPKPEGGEAEVHQTLGFNASPDVRPPTDWNRDRVQAAIGAASGPLNACRAGVQGAFNVTAYVEANGSSGHVLAAGSSAPNAPAAKVVDCLLGVVRNLKLPSPGSYPAKVTFPL